MSEERRCFSVETRETIFMSAIFAIEYVGK